MAFICKLSGHKWKGCLCERCGDKREEGHQWAGSNPVKDNPEVCYHLVCECCGRIEPHGHTYERRKGLKYHYRCSTCENEKVEEHVHDFYDHRCRDCGLFDDTVIFEGDYATITDTKDNGISLIGYRGKGVRELILPEGITYLYTKRYDNIEGNEELEAVKLPSTLKSTGLNTFSGCRNLKRVELNEGLLEIGQNTFSFCSSLVDINFPQSLKTISYGAFSSCSSLGELYLPDSITDISYGAFPGCNSVSFLCHENSAAHSFAEKNNFRFRLLPTDHSGKSAAQGTDQSASIKQPENGKIRHIVCLCYDAPYTNSLKPELQEYIVKAEQERGSIITATSRITFDTFYDNSSLENPVMIRQKLSEIYSQVYSQSSMFELADKSVTREEQYRDGHILVKYYVLYE